MSEPAIKVQKLHKSYKLGQKSLHVLRGVSFEVLRGQFACVVGASGSGKSTLLHILGLLDRPEHGELFLHGQDTSSMSPGRRNLMRSREIGFVFQFYHLLPELNVLENVLLPAKVDSTTLGWMSRRSKCRSRAAELLERLGMSDRITHRSSELSGGERQRVAIARALMNEPHFLLADEPTGNLDSVTGKQIMDVLRSFQKELGQTMIMVTHDASLTAAADKVLHIRDGKLVD